MTLKSVMSSMIKIPRGPFQMGSSEGGDFERPVHEVVLADFWMDSTLVTNREFRRFVQETGYVTQAERQGNAWGYDGTNFHQATGLSWLELADSRDDHPVVLVSWFDAATYAQWVGKRLPTEAEWEKAARGGLIGNLYPWGDAAPNGLQCNFAAAPARIPPTTTVKQFPPNALGLFDMVGNVWQWCSDWYGESAYQDGVCCNPQGPPTGTHRVRRGGSWNVIQAFRLRCANRGAFDPSLSAPNIGFRCAADSEVKLS